MQNSTLPPEVIEYCQRCSKRDGLSIVAYCCYLSLADRTIKAAEASTVNAIAEQFGISPAKTVWIGRKVRRGSLKIKRPQSTDARKLLFFLSLRLAGTDFEMDEREEKAIEHLAKKLKLPSELATRQIAKLKNHRPPRSKTSPANPSLKEPGSPAHPKTSGSIFSQINQTVNQTFVNRKWEADLFQIPHQTNPQPVAELEFTPAENDSPELELSFFDANFDLAGELTVHIGNRCIGGLQINAQEPEYRIPLEPSTDWERRIAGALVSVHLNGKPVLKGEFHSD